ncbi:hypothetical protein CI238_01409 [Colletotrichum incanum]|uniref:Uncharacterized protein n=1 Tax=Colletotrichum incanum TaxID=1573173 RepID=A0A162PRU8_COLIC|nr:hypothetical protein CI238_01409 [Colletotrichum incanum]OHW98175.1 hypothetical protein CSPAE12_02957 [Colletotrichum incanum]
MTQRHSHRRKHESTRLHRVPHRGSAKESTQKEVMTLQPQTIVMPSAGPWSAWALDPERGFYYRTRINAMGRYEWDFNDRSPTTRTPSYTQHAQQYHPPFSAAPASAFRQTLMFPTNPVVTEDKSSSDSEFTYDFDDDVTSRAAGSSFVIPAIIDVDTKNNVKVLVPDPKTGEATIIWNNRHNHSPKSKISADVKVRDWLYKE